MTNRNSTQIRNLRMKDLHMKSDAYKAAEKIVDKFSSQLSADAIKDAPERKPDPVAEASYVECRVYATAMVLAYGTMAVREDMRNLKYQYPDKNSFASNTRNAIREVAHSIVRRSGVFSTDPISAPDPQELDEELPLMWEFVER